MMKNSKKTNAHKCFGILLLALLVSSCSEFSYKRGASAGDLDNAKKTCIAKDSNQIAVNKCMTEAGWFVQSMQTSDSPELDSAALDKVTLDPVAEVFINQDNRQIGIPVDASTKKTVMAKSQNGTAQQALLPKKVADPLEIFNISSWWKLGGGADNLKVALDQCVAILGEEYRPDTQGHIVKRALLLCMKEKGWHGLRSK
jgi:hypothetical protein